MTRNIISVVNQKGGTGKTTIATNLACQYAREGKKTLLIDADKQNSSIDWKSFRPDTVPYLQVVKIPKAHIHKEIEGFSHDVIIIDAGASDTVTFRSAIYAADYCIFPLKPSQADILSTERALEIYSELATTKNIKAGLLLNQVWTNKKIKITGEVENLLLELKEDYDLKIFKTKIYNRLAYQDAFSEGLAVNEMTGDKFKKASDEVSNLFVEVKQW